MPPSLRRLALPLLAAAAPLLLGVTPAGAATSLQCPSAYTFQFRKDVGQSGRPAILRLRVYYSSGSKAFCANGERIGSAAGRPGDTRIALAASGRRDEAQSPNRTDSGRAVYSRIDAYGHARLYWDATLATTGDGQHATGNQLLTAPGR